MRKFPLNIVLGYGILRKNFEDREPVSDYDVQRDSMQNRHHVLHLGHKQDFGFGYFDVNLLTNS